MGNRRDNEFLYNAGMDLLLNWGNHILERPDLNMEDKRLRDMMSTWETSDLLKDAKDATDALLTDAENGRLFFINNPILSSSSEDPLWHDAIKAFDTFDNLLFLWFAAADILWNESREYVQKIETACLKLSDWMANSRDFNFLRFAPLNEWRRERLSQIPEDKHYLYPWYDALSEMQENAVELIAEKWDEIEAKGFGALSFIREVDRSLVWYHLTSDNKLCTALAERRKTEKLVLEAIDRSYALRLLHLSNIHAATRLVPDKFVSSDLERIPHTILTNVPATGRSLWPSLTNIMTSDETASLDRVLLTAFCGPYLSDEQRLSVLKWVESKIKDVHFHPGENDLLIALDSWKNNAIGDDAIVEGIFKHWDELRGKAYVQLLIHDLQNKFSDSLTGISEGIARYFRSLLDCSPRLAFVPLGYNAPGQSVQPEEVVSLEDNATFLPLEFNKNGAFEYLTPVKGFERMDDIINLLNNFICYVGGWYKLRRGNIQTITCEPYDSLMPNTTMPKQDYEFVIICVTTEKNVLKKALAMQQLTKDEAKKIIMITYVPKEE